MTQTITLFPSPHPWLNLSFTSTPLFSCIPTGWMITFLNSLTPLTHFLTNTRFRLMAVLSDVSQNLPEVFHVVFTSEEEGFYQIEHAILWTLVLPSQVRNPTGISPTSISPCGVLLEDEGFYLGGYLTFHNPCTSFPHYRISLQRFVYLGVFHQLTHHTSL